MNSNYRIIFDEIGLEKACLHEEGGGSWVPLDINHYLHLEAKNIKTEVPSIYFDTEQYNSIAMTVYESLMGAFDQCERELHKSGASKYLNLIGIFFHELMKYFSSIYFKQSELETVMASCQVSKLADSSEIETSEAKRYLMGFIKERVGHCGSYGSDSARSARAKRMLKNVMLGSCIPPWRHLRSAKRRAYCTRNVTINIFTVAKELNRASSNSIWHLKYVDGGPPAINLPMESRQLQILKQSAGALCTNLMRKGFINTELHSVGSNAARVISRYLGGGTDSMSGIDVLLTGSLCDIESRIYAAKARSQGIPVVMLWHGGQYGVLDEPVFGYGEQCYVSHVIGYGCSERKTLNGFKFASPLFSKDAGCYHSSSSGEVERLYSRRSIERITDLKSSKLMYVPTSFSGILRYGPYRDIHDIGYFVWQRDLIKEFMGGTSGGILWKRHVKEKHNMNVIAMPGVEYVQDNDFKDVMGNADVYIFDYLSTAFCLAAATSKPIIYFDIGLRNFTAEGLQAIKERCIYVKADPRAPREAYEEFIAMKDKKCSNRFTPEFCLSHDGRKRYKVVADTINQAVA